MTSSIMNSKRKGTEKECLNLTIVSRCIVIGKYITEPNYLHLMSTCIAKYCSTKIVMTIETASALIVIIVNVQLTMLGCFCIVNYGSHCISCQYNVLFSDQRILFMEFIFFAIVCGHLEINQYLKHPLD